MKLTKRGQSVLAGITFASVLTLACFTSVAFAGPEEDAVQGTLKVMFDKPDNPLKFGPVVVVGGDAIADWYQGDMGGRALLWKKDGKWALRLCTGDGVKDAAMLTSNGIAKDQAEKLTKDLAEAEAKTDPKLLAQFASFQGTMMMDKAP